MATPESAKTVAMEGSVRKRAVMTTPGESADNGCED